MISEVNGQSKIVQLKRGTNNSKPLNDVPAGNIDLASFWFDNGMHWAWKNGQRWEKESFNAAECWGEGRAYLVVVDAVDVQLPDLVLLQHLLANVLLALGQRVQQLALHRTETCKAKAKSVLVQTRSMAGNAHRRSAVTRSAAARSWSPSCESGRPWSRAAI